MFRLVRTAVLVLALACLDSSCWAQAVQPDNAGIDRLTLADVIASTYRAFPIIEQARLEAQVASGRATSAWGAYDLRLQSGSLSEPTGFYRNYRNRIGVARNTWWGGYAEAGYRLGSGNFAPWYKERQTNGGGEFSVGLGVPLLQGRAIDASRVAVFQAGVSQQAVGPQVQIAILQYCMDAASAYWEWVAAGGRLIAQEELLELANERQKQFEVGAELGKFAKIDVIFNKQLVAERSSKRIDAEQKFRAAGFKLSLYLRDENGMPLLPDDQWLSKRFPVIQKVDELNFEQELLAALDRRPELKLLALESQQVNWDRRLAENQRLPVLDLISEASQDMGTPTSASNDKGRFELLVGVQSDFPLQRRNAAGKIQQASAKQAQIQQKMLLQRDKIGIELRTALNALLLAERKVEQVQQALEAAFESLQAYRYAFERGYADLLYLNILESKANEVEVYLVDAQRDWFQAMAQTQAASGLDPLEQSLSIAALPLSTRPGVGNLPKPVAPKGRDEELEKTLQRPQNK